MAKIVLQYDDPNVVVSHYDGLFEELERELFAAAERVLGRKPNRAVVMDFNFTMATNPLSANAAATGVSGMPVVVYKTRNGTVYAWNFKREPTRDCLTCLMCGVSYPTPTVVGLCVAGEHVYCCTNTGQPMDAAVHVPVALACAPQSNEPVVERPSKPEPTPVCRWCKGKREITINFKTKPCDCVKQETVGEGQEMENTGAGWMALRRAARNLDKRARADMCVEADGTVGPEDVGVGWKVKKTFSVSA